jgi:hypothetical protein
LSADVQQRLQVEMVGRERERAELSAALDDAAAGRGSVNLLLGEAGMGKTTLAAWVVARAADTSMTVARGGCSAAGMPALWPWRRALAGLAPDLAWRDDSTAIAASDRELLAATVVESLATLAIDHPVLLVLEDLHWADSASMVVLRAVVDAAPSLPLAVVLTARDDPGEMPPETRRQLGQLPTHAKRIALPPLDAVAVAALAGRVLDRALTDDDVDDLCRRTGGNPFFVHEVLRLQAAHGATATLVVPPGVAEVIERRVARLSQPCAALLALAAVAAESSAGVIEDDLVSGEPRASALLEEAVTARLIDADPPNHRFRHALIREVIAAGLPTAERRRMHALVAQRLEARRAAPSSARLAHHWGRADDRHAGARAAHWSLEAARSAVAEFGFETAVEHFRDALAAAGTDHVAVSIELGQALQLSGDTTGAREVLVSAARQAESAGRAVDLARAALALGGGLAGFEVPITDELQSALLTRADELLADDDRAWRAAIRGRLSLARAGSLSSVDRIAMAEDAVELAHRSGDTAVESAVLAAYCDAIPGPDFVQRRIDAANRMIALSESRGRPHDQSTLLLARRLLLVALIENGNLGAAESQALAYEQIAARLGSPLYGWLPEIWRGMQALLVGDVAAAFAHADMAERIGRRAHSFNAELMVFTQRMQAHLDRGTPEHFASDVRAILDRLGPLGMPAMYLAAPARLLLAAGESWPAHAVLRAFVSGDPQAMPKDAEWLEAHWAMADIAIQLDDRTAAEGLYEALLPYARLWAVDGIGGAVFGAIAEQLARLAAHLGRASAAAHLEDAKQQYERQRTPALLARLLRTTTSAASPPGTARMHHAGAIWQLEWHGRRSTVADAKGLHDLARLVARPGQSVPATDLVEAGGGPAAAAVGGSLGPVLDETARRAYRSRLAELDRDLDDAETSADLGRAERIRAERDMLIDELAAATGLGGRVRIAGDPADRARKSVTMRVRAAIRTIDRHDPELARHLTNTIRTGRLCSYQPESPVDWQT